MDKRLETTTTKRQIIEKILVIYWVLVWLGALVGLVGFLRHLYAPFYQRALAGAGVLLAAFLLYYICLETFSLLEPD